MRNSQFSGKHCHAKQVIAALLCTIDEALREYRRGRFKCFLQETKNYALKNFIRKKRGRKQSKQKEKHMNRHKSTTEARYM